MAAVLSYTKAKSQVKALLQATRTAYADTVDGSKRQFASDTEIDDGILYADGEVCTAIAQTPGHPFSNAFTLTSSAIARGTIAVPAQIPSHIGRIVNIGHCATTNGTYTNCRFAKSREQVIDMVDNASLFGSATYQLDYCFVEDLTLYIVDAFAKVIYTDYVKTTSPQAPESYASAVVWGAISRLLKDGGDAEVSGYYGQLYQNALQEIRMGARMLPAIETK